MECAQKSSAARKPNFFRTKYLKSAFCIFQTRGQITPVPCRCKIKTLSKTPTWRKHDGPHGQPRRAQTASPGNTAPPRFPLSATRRKLCFSSCLGVDLERVSEPLHAPLFVRSRQGLCAHRPILPRNICLICSFCGSLPASGLRRQPAATPCSPRFADWYNPA